MSRPKLIRTTVFPYHVRSRSNNQEWFYLPPGELWEIFVNATNIAAERYQTNIIAFVLMGNHFHLIVSTPHSNLGAFMQYLIRETSKRIGTKSGRINRIFGGRYQRSLLDGECYFLNVYKYIYRNPVVAGMCLRVEDYPFSTVRALTIDDNCDLRVCMEPEWVLGVLPRGDAYWEWLNAPFAKEQAEVVRRGLRRSKCRWTSDRRYRRWVSKLK